MLRRTLLAAGLAAAAPAFGQTLDAPLEPPLLSALTGIAVTTTDGAATTLGAHLGPGPAVVQFWATWCSPCLAESRHLARLRERVPAARLNIVGLNMDRLENRANGRAEQFRRRARMNYPQLNGTVAFYRAFNNPGEGGQVVLPRLYVFHADGRPAAAFGRYNGAATLREVDRAVEQVLA